MTYRPARFLALASFLVGIVTIALLLGGRLDPWGWPAAALVLGVVVVQSGLMVVTRCSRCGKSQFLVPRGGTAPGQALRVRRSFLPEQTCSACGHRNDYD